MAVFVEACRQRNTLVSGTLSSGADGHVSGTADYDIFGEPVTETGVFAANSTIVFAYAGKPYDPVTGLSDYGFRDYAPTLARFTTVDPIRDSSNWYAYCNGDPVNYVDAWGLEDIVIFHAIDLDSTPNEILYRDLVNDDYGNIVDAAAKANPKQTVDIIRGQDATQANFEDIYTGNYKGSDGKSAKRVIVVAHGDEDGQMYDVNGVPLTTGSEPFLSNPGKDLQIIDIVGCYASNGLDKWNNSSQNIEVRTYNPGCTQPDKPDKADTIKYYQTNHVLDTVIPESIINNDYGSFIPKEPARNKIIDMVIKPITGSYNNSNNFTKTENGCETNNH